MALNDGIAESPENAFIFKEWLLDFSADRLTKQQMEDLGRPERYDGEKRLFFEVWRDALESFVKESKPKKQNEHHHRTAMRLSRYEEHRRWIFDDPADPQWPFTFDNCCEEIGLSPNYVRKLVRRVAIDGYEKVKFREGRSSKAGRPKSVVGL